MPNADLALGWNSDDLSAHLPVSAVEEFRKGDSIYGPDAPAVGLYLVLSGNVKVSRVAPDGREVVLDVYCRDDFFGESALAGGPGGETAAALTETRIMSWTAAALRELVHKRPELASALLSLAVVRARDFGVRIESLCNDNIEKRLAAALLHFAERLGTESADGGLEMISFTHALLAQYVGTSREIVTHYMNDFRRRGSLDYSRRSITVFSKKWTADLVR